MELKAVNFKENKRIIAPDLEAWAAEALRKEKERVEIENLNAQLNKIPARFLGKTFDDYQITNDDQNKIKSIFKRFVDSFEERLSENTNLILLGNPGTGKTLLSFIAYQQLIKNKFTVEYKTRLHFLKLLQEKKFASFNEFDNAINFYKKVNLLILDEVTEGSGSEGNLAGWEREILSTIIDARYQSNNVCTIIISNRFKSELKTRLGDPIVDRLSENSVTLAFNWESFRK